MLGRVVSLLALENYVNVAPFLLGYLPCTRRPLTVLDEKLAVNAKLATWVAKLNLGVSSYRSRRRFHRLSKKWRVFQAWELQF